MSRINLVANVNAIGYDRNCSGAHDKYINKEVIREKTQRTVLYMLVGVVRSFPWVTMKI